MRYSIKHRFRQFTLLIVFTMLGMTLPLQHAAAGLEAHSKIDPLIVDGYSESDKVVFFIKMASDASLSEATSIINRVSRIQFVKDTLENHAEQTQASVLQLLRDNGVSTEIFWINNSIFVRGASSALAKTLARSRTISSPARLARMQSSDANCPSRCLTGSKRQK